MSISSKSFLFLAVVVFCACKKETSLRAVENDAVEKNKPPVAYAGLDHSIVLPQDSVLLDGSSSHDGDGYIVKYKWTQINAPSPVVIVEPDAAKSIARGFTAGIYYFQLKVTDDKGASALDTVQVSVSAVNKEPLANAGADQVIVSPQNWALLDGSHSKDPDGDIVWFAWTKVTGPNVGIEKTQVPDKYYTAFIVGLNPGVYQFQLEVKDNDGATAKDTIKIEVLPDSLIQNASTKSFQRLYWGNKCTIDIENISSGVHIGSAMQVFIRYYEENPWYYSYSSGWIKTDPVRNSSFWYELSNDRLIIHAPEHIDCGWDPYYYDVLVKWP